MSVNKFLKQLTTGDNVRDFAHASRTFVDGNFDHQPYYKQLFHVVFNFSSGALQSQKFFIKETHRDLHMAVKSVDLPQFDIQTQDRNQYNRHRHTQHRINYRPVTIRFHDDQSNMIRLLWQSYYQYYYNDSNYQMTATDTLPRQYTTQNIYSSGAGSSAWGMDKGPAASEPNEKMFFSDIRIYTMFQKKFVETILVNPIISSFQYDTHSYAENDMMEHTMTLEYESVKYATGFNDDDAIKTFAKTNYDKNPSPLTPLGGGTNSIFHRGGLIDGTNAVLSDISNGNILGAVLTGARMGGNIKNMDFKQVITGELLQAGKNVLRGDNAGFVFPKVGNFDVGQLVTDNITKPASGFIKKVTNAVTSQGKGVGVNTTAKPQAQPNIGNATKVPSLSRSTPPKPSDHIPK